MISVEEIVASGESKKYLGKNYSLDDVNEMGSDEKELLLARYNAIKKSELASSLKDTFCSVVAEVGCKVLAIKDVKSVRDDLTKDSFTSALIGHFASVAFNTFGFALAPVTVGSIFVKHKMNETEDNKAINYNNETNESKETTYEVDAIAQQVFDNMVQSI